MDAPHAIDRTRLPRLQALKDAEYAAASKADERVNDIRHQRREARERLILIENVATQDRQQASELKIEAVELRKKIERLVTQTHEAEAERDALRERAAAAGGIYEGCAKFMGFRP